MWVGGDCLTQVEAGEATIRRSVYGSLYPLAEWIVANWWFLNGSIRPSAVPSQYWTWPNVRNQPWLWHHNLRAAGEGMAWPDLTIVPEGATTHLRWSGDDASAPGQVRFVSTGHAVADSHEVIIGLAQVVTHVLERLAEEDLQKTRLAQEWAALGALDAEEAEFCATAARLGLDPLTVDERLAAEIVDAASVLAEELFDDFVDSVDPGRIQQAVQWTRRASKVAARASGRARLDLGHLQQAAARGTAALNSVGRAWQSGYAMARNVREELDGQAATPVDLWPWIAVGETKGSAGGMQGVAAVVDNRCGVVLGDIGAGRHGRTFAAARALGRALARPAQRSFLLSPARGPDERVARAFAAELLAPAAGIRAILDALGSEDEEAFEVVAGHFGVSPMLIQHQYDNQLARRSG